MDSIDSTNEEIKREADKFIKTTWVLARSQTQGKGRNGKVWFDGKNNFTGSNNPIDKIIKYQKKAWSEAAK